MDLWHEYKKDKEQKTTTDLWQEYLKQREAYGLPADVQWKKPEKPIAVTGVPRVKLNPLTGSAMPNTPYANPKARSREFMMASEKATQQQERYAALHQQYGTKYESGNIPIDTLSAGIENTEQHIQELEEKIEYFRGSSGSVYGNGEVYTNTPETPEQQSEQSQAILEERKTAEAELEQERKRLEAMLDEYDYYWTRAFLASQSDENYAFTAASGKKAYEQQWKERSRLAAQRDNAEYLGTENVVDADRVRTAVDTYSAEHPAAVSIEHMSDEEKEMFYYLVGSGNAQMAAAYANECAVASRRERIKQIEDWAGKNVWTGIAAHLAQGLLFPLAGADMLLAGNDIKNTGLDVSTNIGPAALKDAMNSGISQKMNSRGTIPEQVPIIRGKGLGDLYSLGVSMNESYGSAMAFGPFAIAFMGMSAASSTYNDAIMRGASHEQAQRQGLAAGIAEALFEKISIGHFLDGKDYGSFIKNLLVQGGVEASEEALTSLTNEIVDRANMMNLSTFETNVRGYMDDGMSRKEAEKRANRDFWEGVAYDALGGFLTGGFMGGGQSAARAISGAISENKFIEKLNAAKGSTVYKAFAGAAGVIETDSDAQANEKFRKWYRDGGEYVADTIEAIASLADSEMEEHADESDGADDSEKAPSLDGGAGRQAVSQTSVSSDGTINSIARLDENYITDGGNIDESTEILDDGGQRDAGMGTGGQAGAVAEGTGRSVSRSQARAEAAVLSHIKGNAQAQSPREIGVEDGSTEQSLYVLSDEDIEQSERWKRIKADAEEDGARVVLFAGDLKVYNRSTKGYSKVEGIHQTDSEGNTTYYIKADKHSRNAEQIYIHEKFHDIVSRNPGLLPALMEELEERYGQQEIAALVNSYVEAYDGIYGRLDESMTADEQQELVYRYMEEVFADVYAGIKRGARSTASAKKVMESQTDEIQRAAQNRKATGQKTAPPEQRFAAEERNERLTENDLDEYMTVGERMHTRNAKQRILASGKSPILLSEKEIHEFIGASIDGHEKNNIRAYGKVGTGMAREVREIEPSVNIEGYYLELEANHLEHLSDHIENDTDVRNIPLTPEQAKRIPEYLDSYDDVLEVTKKKDGSIRIVFGKKINGYAVIVETVSKGRKSIHTRTAWQNKTEEYLRKYKKVDGSATPNGASANSGQDTGPSDEMIAKTNDVVKQEFSVEDDAAELDRQYQQTMAEDDYAAMEQDEDTGLAEYFQENERRAREKIHEKAKKATVQQLRAGIKSAQKRIQEQQRVLQQAIENGVTENVLREKIETNIKNANATLTVFRAELNRRTKPTDAEAQAKELREAIKEKEDSLRTYSQLRRLLQEGKALKPQRAKEIQRSTEALKVELKEDRAKLKELQKTLKSEKKAAEKKKHEEEIKVQNAQQSKEELVEQVLSLFSTAKGVKLETREMLYEIADEIKDKGYISNESRDKLLKVLYENGEVLAEKDEYFSDIRKFTRHSRIYVPESVRAEFRDDWKAFSRKAWENQIYLTDNRNDMGIDSMTQELEDVFGGAFSQEDDLKTQLERIIDLAEEGKAERLTLTEMMRRNQNDYGWSVEEQMDELERKLDEALRRFSEKANIEIRTKQKGLRELMRQREDFRQMREKQAEQRAISALMQQVIKRAQELKKYHKRTTPTVQKMIDEQIGDLDTLARSISAEGLENLQRILYNYKKTRDELGKDAFIVNPEIEQRLDRLQKIQLADMDIEDVRELGEALTGIITQIRNYNRMVSAERSEYISDMAQEAQREIENAKGRKNDSRLQKHMQNHLDAKRFFGKISGFVDGAWERLAGMLSHGEELQRQYQMRAMELFNSFLEDPETAKWLKEASGKNAKWEKVIAKGTQLLKGETVTEIDVLELTSMMKIALLMHSKNADNLRHIGRWEREGDSYVLTGGGMVIPNREEYRKGKMKEAYAKGDVVRIPPETVRAIAKSCTAQEKAFAELLTKYFDGMAKSAINEVSLAVDGWERATVTNYFPIQSDKAFLVTENELVKQDLSLQSSAFLKERSHKGSNPIYLLDASDVLFRNIDQVSRYYGMTRALRDLHAVMNATYYTTSKAAADLTAENELLRRVKEQEGWGKVSFGSVQKSLENKWGRSAVEYIQNISKDLQGASNTKAGFLAKLRGNYARAVISFNISSVLKQTASYPVALAYLDVGDLAAGLLKDYFKKAKQAVNTLSKYSAVYWYRNQGNTRTEIREYMERKGVGERLPLGFKWTQMMDSAVTRRLLAACMHHVSKTGLQPGSQENIENGTDRYWTEVTKLFNKVVLNTQSNSSTMERPQFTRKDPNSIDRFLTMFKTDAFQQFNMIVEAKGRLKAANEAYKADPSRANKKRLQTARKQAGKTMGGIFAGQLWVGAVTALLSLALFRDKDYWDEEGNFLWDKFLLDFALNVGESFAGFVVGLDWLWSGAEAKIMGEKWYGPEVQALESLITIYDDATGFFKAAANLDWVESKRQFHNLAKSAGMVFGFPVANIEKYLLSVARYVVPEWATKYENFWDELEKEDIRNRSPRLMEETVSVIMDNRVDELSDEDKTEIARLYRMGGTGAVPTGIPTSVSYTTEDGEEITVALNAKQREQYRDIWNDTVSGVLSELLDSEDYADADDELKTEYIDKLYKYASQIAQNAVVPEKELEKWVQQGIDAADNGIPISEYITFRVDMGDITGKNASGESIDGLAMRRKMDLLESMGWTDKQEREIYLDVLVDDEETRKKKEGEINSLLKSGLNWDQANDIVLISSQSKKLKWEAVANMNLSQQEKADAMAIYANESEKNLIRTGLSYGIKMEWYAEVMNNADKNGKSGVSQEEAKEYIYSMDLYDIELAYLWQMVTDGKPVNNPFSSSYGYDFWLEVHKDDPIKED